MTTDEDAFLNSIEARIEQWREDDPAMLRNSMNNLRLDIDRLLNALAGGKCGEAVQYLQNLKMLIPRNERDLRWDQYDALFTKFMSLFMARPNLFDLLKEIDEVNYCSALLAYVARLEATGNCLNALEQAQLDGLRTELNDSTKRIERMVNRHSECPPVNNCSRHRRARPGQSRR